MPDKAESHQGRASLLLVTGGNVATILSSIESTRSFLLNTTGFNGLRYLLISFSVIIFLGYIMGFLWVARKFVIGGQSATAYSWGFLGMALVPAMLFVNYSAIPARADPRSILQERIPHWTELLISFQKSSGGIQSLPEASSKVQVWATAQVLKAILDSGHSSGNNIENIRKAFDFMESRRLTDGWPYFDDFDWPVAEVTGWVTLANISSIESKKIWDEKQLPIVTERIKRDLDAICRSQLPSGGWSPISGGTEETTRTYSTLISVWSLLEAKNSASLSRQFGRRYDDSIRNGLHWLIQAYSNDSGWTPNPNRKSQFKYYRGLTAQVLFVLRRAGEAFPFVRQDDTYKKAKSRFLLADDVRSRSALANDSVPDADVYIAGPKPGSGRMIEATTFLWFPWSVAALADLEADHTLLPSDRNQAKKTLETMLLKTDELLDHIGSGGNYETAENILCLSHALRQSAKDTGGAKQQSLLSLVSETARHLPGKERENPLLPYLVTTASILMIFIALRTHIWRLKSPKLSSASDVNTPCTILLPVRNEEHNVSECVGSLLQQTASATLKVIDDNSEDRTRELVGRLQLENGRLRLLDAGPLSKGWRGKLHALNGGLQEVRTPWILTTDADTRHDPALLARALSTTADRQLDSLSVAGFQEAIGLGENLLTPAVFALLDGLLGDWRNVADGDSDVGNGQFMLLRKEALEKAGGFEAIRHEALDDVALIKRLRANGYRHAFFRAPELLRIRMYRGFWESFHGWRRNLGALLRGKHLLAAYLLFLMLFPPLLMVLGIFSEDWAAVVVTWLAGSTASCLFRYGSRHSILVGLLYPLDVVLLSICAILGLTDAWRGELASWKGRPMLLRIEDRPK